MNDAAQSQEIAILQTPLTPALVYQKEGGADDVLKKIKEEVRSRVLDISTPEGRKEIRSLAYKVARTKTALDDMGKDLTEEQKRVIDSVNESRRKIRADLDALKEEVMKPLSQWEEAEEKRTAAHEGAIAQINVLGQVNWAETTAAEIQERISRVKEYGGRDWQEFVMRGSAAFDTALAALDLAAASRKKYDEDQAELARMKAEQEARDQKEAARKKAHEDAIAEIGAISDIGWSEFSAQQIQEKIDQIDPYRARHWEEFKDAAQSAIDTAAKFLAGELAARIKYDDEQAELEKRRAEDEENARIRKEKEEADAKLEKAEGDRKAAHEKEIERMRRLCDFPEKFSSMQVISRIAILEGDWKAGRDWQEYADQAQKAYEETKAYLEQHKDHALSREKEAADAAEKKRLDDIEAAAQSKIAADAEAERKRAADRDHKALINNAVLTAIMQHSSISEAAGKSIVEALARGLIPHTKISY